MMMTIFQPRQPPRLFDEREVYAGVNTAQDMELIRLAVKTGRPSLVGLDGVSTIIKPRAEGDDTLSFEALYDECNTISHLPRMAAAGVDDPAKIPPDFYRLRVAVPFSFEMVLNLAVSAQNPGALPARLAELQENDETFLQELERILARGFVHIVARRSTFDLDIERLEKVTADDPLDPPIDPAGPQWRFLTDTD